MTTIREWLSHLRNKTKQSVEKTKVETKKTYNKILDTEIDDIKSQSKSTLKNIDEKLVDASETFKSDVSKTSKIIGKFFYKFLKYSLILIIFIGFLFTLPSIISSFKDEIVPYFQNYTKADYQDNRNIMQFEGNIIHPYVFYYIQRNLHDRYVSEVDIGEQIDLNKFYNSVDLVQIGAKKLGGQGGGGRPDFAQAGGPLVNEVDAAIAAIRFEIEK